MLDTSTFLLELYVMCDDFCQSGPKRAPRPGTVPSLSGSEVVTLCVFSQWRQFASERDFHLWAQRHLRGLFPTLPCQEQFNRLTRQHHALVVEFWAHLTRQLLSGAKAHPGATGYFEALDATGVATRHVSRRGAALAG